MYFKPKMVAIGRMLSEKKLLTKTDEYWLQNITWVTQVMEKITELNFILYTD